MRFDKLKINECEGSTAERGVTNTERLSVFLGEGGLLLCWDNSPKKKTVVLTVRCLAAAVVCSLSLSSLVHLGGSNHKNTPAAPERTKQGSNEVDPLCLC